MTIATAKVSFCDGCLAFMSTMFSNTFSKDERLAIRRVRPYRVDEWIRSCGKELVEPIVGVGLWDVWTLYPWIPPLI